MRSVRKYQMLQSYQFVFQAKVTSKELLNSLRRRIKQMTLTKNFAVNTQTTVNISCSNNCSLSWKSAIETLIEIENSNTSRWKHLLHKLLSISELIQLANLLRGSTAVSTDELLFYVPSRLKDLSIVVNQLISHLPLLFVKKPNCQYLVNMHKQNSITPGWTQYFRALRVMIVYQLQLSKKRKEKAEMAAGYPFYKNFRTFLMQLQNSLKPAVLKPRKK